MPKVSYQKKRILILRDMLLERTDEQHPLTMKEIQAYLSVNGVGAGSRIIQDDIRTLQVYGIDIIDGRKYYVASREFELPELKILADCVQASKFITEKKTEELIRKLGTLCSKHEAGQIRGSVYHNNSKSENEDIYRIIDIIQQAISADKRITFQYQQYSPTKQLSFRRNGKKYVASPCALVYNDENYYLVAAEGEHWLGVIKHFRVDKIKNVQIEKDSRSFNARRFNDADISDYLKQKFSMYDGNVTRVTLQFPNHLAGVVIDRFGRNTTITEAGEGYFQITVGVAVSPQFFGWIFGLGEEVKIISPAPVVQRMKDLLKDTYKTYTIPRNRRKNKDSSSDDDESSSNI